MSRKYGEAMKVKVVVMPKAAVLDPQGNAVRDAMQHLGMPEVRSVRIGRDLLSNPVIEDYELTKNEEPP
jgi:phosphoribosylformylglycinamidine (FGAM) synthase PurS component